MPKRTKDAKKTRKMSKKIKQELKEDGKEKQETEKPVETLQEELKELEKEDKETKQDYLSDLQRVQAEFENYMKRVEKERVLLGDFAKRELLLKFVNIVDEFEAAIHVIKDAEDKTEILKGVEMLFKNMHKVLESEHVKVINAFGEEFDPYYHDAIAKISGEENKIIEEVKKGYMFNDKLLRPSIVKVGNGQGGKNE